MAVLNIYDGNVYLNMGARGFGERFNAYGFPTGGVYSLLAPIIKERNGYHVVVFDSRTSRKGVEGYKSNRQNNPSVIVQGKFMERMLKNIGVPVVRRDGYETDDLIDKIVKDNINRFPHTVIHTVDMDLAANIDSNGKVSIQSPSVKSHNVTVNNYKYTVHPKYDVPFNMIRPFKVFLGDVSDHIGVGKTYNGKKLWEQFQEEIPEAVSNCNLWSYAKVLDYFLIKHKKEIGEAGIKELLMRKFLVYPFETTEEFIIGEPCIDKEILVQYLKALRMKKYLKVLTGSDDLECSKTYLDYMMNLGKGYKDGTLLADMDCCFEDKGLPRLKLNLVGEPEEKRSSTGIRIPVKAQDSDTLEEVQRGGTVGEIE